jgi:hypothetical protein
MKWLSGILAVYFLLGSLLPKCDWEELPKLAAMVDHFEEHRLEAGSNFTFLDFIEMHYIDPTEDQSDAEHHNLPFYHHHTAPFVAVLPTFYFQIQHHELLIDFSSTRKELQPREHSNSIFQPPRA